LFPDNGREGRIRELDGWRAVSVFLVLLHHIGTYQYPGRFSHFRGAGHVLYYFGPLGVKVFFVISGFVICRLLILEESRYGSVSLKAFYVRRIFRILPPLYIYLGAISVLLAIHLVHERWSAILNAALFLYDIRLPPQSWLVGHTWSLAVEEQFYLVFPGIWVLTPGRWKSGVFLATFFLCGLWTLSMAVTGWDALVYSYTRAGLACISCGVVMAIHEERARHLAARVPATIATLVAVILILHPVGLNSWPAVIYEGFLTPVAIGIVLLFSLSRGLALRAFLCSRPVQAIGLTSYGVYLWQQLFTAPAEYFSGASQVIPLLLPLLCLIVPLSYFLIEKPAMRFGKSVSKRIRNNSTPTTA
jgi:peptidoglycan/LPS O-acetylase OafA/YrhL